MALSKLNNDSFADTAVHGRRNIIINGAMQIAQRGTQTDQGGGSSVYGAVDRFQIVPSGAKTARVTSSQQSTTVGEFTKQLKLDCTTAQSSVAAADLLAVRTRIEGQNLQHLQYGTSSAKTLTASFTITSPKSGTHCIQLHHRDASYSYVREFTVDAANTAQRISITFPGYTTTALDDDTGSSLELAWPLITGSNWHGTKDSWVSGNVFSTSNQQNLMDNTANNFLITGVQLEVGDKATPFEHRSFSEELFMCERYFQKTYKHSDAFGTNTAEGCINFVPHNTGDSYSIAYSQEMRANPTVTTTRKNGSANSSAQRGDNSGNYNALTVANIGTRSYDLTPGTAASRNYRFHHKLEAEL